MTCYYCSKPSKSKFCSIQCVGAFQKEAKKQEYNTNPKFCKNCKNPLSYDNRKNTFCDKSCAAQYNNTGRYRSFESRLRASNALFGRGKLEKSDVLQSVVEAVKTSIFDWDWVEVQDFYNQGHGTRACERKFHFSFNIWKEAKEQGLFVTNPPPSFDLEAALTENSKAKRDKVKKHLILSGLRENKCAVCKREPVWEDKPLVLVLDHINGVHNDNRLHNLRLLCPNCNSQTDTFCRGNHKKTHRVPANEILKALKQCDTIKEALALVGMEPTANNYGRVGRMLNPAYRLIYDTRYTLDTKSP